MSDDNQRVLVGDGKIFIQSVTLPAAHAIGAAFIEAIAKWHDGEAAAFQRACDAAWADCVPDIGLQAVAFHRAEAARLRALDPALVLAGICEESK